MHISRKIRKAQAGVIGGIVIIAILFAIALPLVLQYQQGTQSIAGELGSKEAFLEQRNKESLTVAGIPLTTENLLSGNAPGVWVNNTGLIPATLKRLWLVKPSGDIYAIIDLSKPNTGLLGNITIITGNNTEYNTTAGKLPVLQPGDKALIRLNIPLIDASTLRFYVETSTGTIHPRNKAPPALAPSTQAGGATGNTTQYQARLYNIFTPQTSFNLVGYNAIRNFTTMQTMRPRVRVTTFYSYYESVVSWSWGRFIWETHDIHVIPLSSKPEIILDPETDTYTIIAKTMNEDILGTLTADFYDQLTYWAENGTGSLSLGREIGFSTIIVIEGFVGSISVTSISISGLGSSGALSVSGIPAIFLDGWCRKISIEGYGEISGISDDFYHISASDEWPLKYDLNDDGISEYLVISTINPSDQSFFDADEDSSLYGVDPYGSVSDTNDVLISTMRVFRYVTGIDAIEVTLKLSYLYRLIENPSYPVGEVTPTATVRIGVEVYNESTGDWSLVFYHDHWISVPRTTEATVQSAAFHDVFPVDRDRIYRLVLVFYDPIGLMPTLGVEDGNLDPSQAPRAELIIGLESITMLLHKYNPTAKSSPQVFLIAIPDAGTRYIGGEGNLTNYLNAFEYYLQRMGINDYIVINNYDELEKLLYGNPPLHAIIFDLNGGVLPLAGTGGTYTSYLEELGDIVKNNGLIWVFPLVGGDEWAVNQTESLGRNMSLEDIIHYLTGYYIQLYNENITASLTPIGITARAIYTFYEVPSQTGMAWYTTSSAASPVFYHYYNETTGEDLNYTFALKVTGSEYVGYLLVSGFGPLYWGSSIPEGYSNPDTVAATAVCFSLYLWASSYGFLG